MSIKESRDPKEDWERTWKELVENTDGTLNREAIMNELSDYSMLIDHLSRIYSEMSGEVTGNACVLPEVLMQLYKEELTDQYQMGYSDAIEDLSK